MAELKKVQEVFSDYKTELNIKETEIETMNLIKKTNELELILISDEYIEIKELWFFEKFLRERFQFSNVNMKIKYNENVNKKTIDKEWTNLICYMIHKHPLMRPMILLKSEIEIVGNTIKVMMKIQGADFLKARKLDIELEKVIGNIFGYKYKVDFIENLNNEDRKSLADSAAKSEKKAIELALEHMSIGEKIAEDIKENNKKKEEKTKDNNINIKNINEIDPPPFVHEEIEEELNTPLIYGRNMNFKSNVVNVVDISPEDDIAAISGEILAGTIEERELKSGKFLISFNVYDGTSTVTCKIFVKPEEKKKVVGKLKDAKGVKLEGKSGISNFSHEMEIMANVVIETEGMKKITRQDLAETKRVELHMHTNMSQMDAMSSATSLIKRAMKWGMKSIAITDHGVVQAFPEAHKLL